MMLKSSKSVAMEKRMDLASLFCMIGRHGPAVAVVVFAMISVLAAFIIYRRTVRGKRGKATAAGAERDTNSRGEERDAPVHQEGERESYSSSVESTDVDDGDSPDLMKDPDLIQNHHKVRQRSAAAVEVSSTVLKKYPLYSPSSCDKQISDYKHTASDGSKSPEWDISSYKTTETYRDKINHHFGCDTNSEPENKTEAVHSHQDTKDETFNDVNEVIHYNDSCLKESTDDEKKQEEEQVFKAEHQEASPDEDVTTDESFPHKTDIQEEDVQCVMKNLLSQTPSENDDDVRLQDNKSLQEEKESEPVVHVKDISVSVKDEHEEEHQSPDSTNYTNYFRDSNLSSEEEKKDEGEEEKECADHQLIVQQTEVWPTTFEQETTLHPVSHQKQNEQQDQHDHVTERDIVEDDEDGAAVQIIEEDITEDSDLTTAGHDAHSPQSKELQTKLKEENCQKSDGNIHVLPILADNQVKDQKPTHDDVATCVTAVEHDSSTPILTCVNQPSEEEKVDGGDEGRTEEDISGVMFGPQQPQSEQKDETAPLLDKDSELHSNAPNLLSSYKDQQSGQMVNDEQFEEGKESLATGSDKIAFDGDTVNVHVPAEEIYCPHQEQQRDNEMNNEAFSEMRVTTHTDAVACDVKTELCPPVCQNQQSGQNTEAFDESNIASGPKTAIWDDGNDTAPVNTEQISYPDVPSVSQNQQSGQNSEAFDMEKSATGLETATCDNDINTAPVMVEEVAHPHLLSFRQDQQSGLKINIGTFDESLIASGPDRLTCDDGNVTAPVNTDEISCPPLPSLHQDPQKDQTVDNKPSDKESFGTCPEMVACNGSNIAPLITVEEISCPPLPYFYQDQQSDQTTNNKTFDKASADASPDTLNPDEDKVTASVMPEKMSCSLLPSSHQNQESGHNEGLIKEGSAAVTCDGDNGTAPLFKNQQSAQTVNNEGFIEATIAADACDGDEFAAPVMAEEVNPPVNHLHLLSFDQSETRGNDTGNMASPGADEESGISSTTLSPDFQEDGDESEMSALVLPPSSHYSLTVGQIEAHRSNFTDDIMSKSVIHEDAIIAGMAFEPQLLPLSLEQTDVAICVSFGGNEDVFGQEIEDKYHREIDHFTVQMAASIRGLTDEPKKQMDTKDVTGAEIKEKKEGISVEKKDGAQGEKEEEEDYEKTEISIMEATMDNNEWIEDSNYEVLPWMNFSLKSLDQEHTKTEQLPRAEHQQESTVVIATSDGIGMDERDTGISHEAIQTSTLSLTDESRENNEKFTAMTDITSSTEAKQTSTFSTADENSKKVVAVPPMPQNVNVTFRVHYLTHSQHQMVAVTGNQQELGGWKGFIPLERAKDGFWASMINLPADTLVEWKFVVVNKGEVCRWEECENRLLETGCGEDLYVHKWWGFL